MNISSRDTRSGRRPRTFELRDAEWVEATPDRPPRPPLWLLIPAALLTLTTFVLMAFAAIAALATAGLVALRESIVRLFRR
jgi:hypothetical protein